MKFTIKKRKDGIYYAEKMYKGQRYYFTSKNKSEVEKQLLNFERNKKNNTMLENTPLTVSQWTNKWLQMYKQDVEKRTYDMYSDAIKLYIIPSIGKIKLIDLKQSHIINMLNDIGNKNRTKEIVLLTTKQIIKKAIENDYISKNIAEGIKLKKVKSKEKKPISNEMIELIKNIVSIYPDMFIFYFIIYTGLRAEEVVALQKQDINLKTKEIFLKKAYDFRHKEFKDLKNHEKRKIPIFNNIFPMLEEQFKKSQLFLFSQSNGNIITYDVIRKRIDKLKKLLKQSYPELSEEELTFTTHSLRHTFCCILYKANIPPKQAQQWTGHKDIKVLLDIYTHLDAEDNKDAVNKVNSFIDSSNHKKRYILRSKFTKLRAKTRIIY